MALKRPVPGEESEADLSLPLLFCFEIVSHTVVQAGLELSEEICLPLPPKLLGLKMRVIQFGW